MQAALCVGAAFVRIFMGEILKVKQFRNIIDRIGERPRVAVRM
jgi:hypothetical protein